MRQTGEMKMSAAAYVGRVGSLAAVLGVGAALITGHGVASAEPSDSEGTTSSSFSSSGSDDAASGTGRSAQPPASASKNKPRSVSKPPASTASGSGVSPASSGSNSAPGTPGTVKSPATSSDRESSTPADDSGVQVDDSSSSPKTRSVTNAKADPDAIENATAGAATAVPEA